jgi:hypothetical protein
LGVIAQACPSLGQVAILPRLAFERESKFSRLGWCRQRAISIGLETDSNHAQEGIASILKAMRERFRRAAKGLHFALNA